MECRLIKFSLSKHYYEWITDLDPDGSVRLLVLRALIGIVLTVWIDSKIGQDSHYLIWGILGFFNILVVMSLTSKKNSLKTFIFASIVFGISLILGTIFHDNSPFFFLAVALVAFLGGLLAAYGPIGKVIGVMSFVHFAVASSKLFGLHEQGLMMLSYGTGVFAIAVVYFLLIPIPTGSVVTGAKKRFYRYLRKVLAGELDPTTQQSRMILVGIKENLLNRAPEQSDIVLQKLVKLRNSVMMLVRFNDKCLVDNPIDMEISQEINIVTIALINLLKSVERDEYYDANVMLFSYAKANLFEKIKRLTQQNSTTITSHELLHFSSAMYILDEIESVVSSEKSTHAA
jgi:hypothetical protein